MNWLDLIRISLRTLRKNKLRSGLTVLGVVIGIASVTTMVSLGQSASQLVQQQFRTLGSNVIFVQPAGSQFGGVRSGSATTLTEADARAIAAECPSVLAVSPAIGTHSPVTAGPINWRPNLMLGVGSDYPTVRNSPLAGGNFFTAREVQEASQVCVLGHTVARQLFPDTDPVGRQVQIKNLPFTVVGVLERKGGEPGRPGPGQRGADALHHRAEAAPRLGIRQCRFGRCRGTK